MSFKENPIKSYYQRNKIFYLQETSSILFLLKILLALIIFTFTKKYPHFFPTLAFLFKEYWPKVFGSSIVQKNVCSDFCGRLFIWTCVYCQKTATENQFVISPIAHFPFFWPTSVLNFLCFQCNNQYYNFISLKLVSQSTTTEQTIFNIVKTLLENSFLGTLNNH